MKLVADWIGNVYQIESSVESVAGVMIYICLRIMMFKWSNTEFSHGLTQRVFISWVVQKRGVFGVSWALHKNHIWVN